MEAKLIKGTPASAKRHIFFVHGLRGNIETTWTSQTSEGSFFWPEWLDDDLSEISLWSLGYPASFTDWLSFSPKLSPLADNMLAWFLAKEDIQHGEIVFVAHSYGGLVVEKTLLAAKRDAPSKQKAADLLARTKRVAFMGTPHRGSFLANMALLFPWFFRVANSVRTLAVGNETVASIYDEYRAFARHQNIKHLLLCEGRPLMVFGLNLSFKIVSSQSAHPGLAENPITLIDEDHKSICKPTDRGKDAYVLLLAFLKENDTPPLPPGFANPEILAKGGGFRARLQSDVQTYVPSTKADLNIETLLTTMQSAKPLMITGGGGLGKTRLALELYRASGLQGVLIQKDATRNDIEALIQHAKNDNNKVIFIIDYIEELGALYDPIHQLVTRTGEDFAYLITTTRNPSGGDRGPKYLTGQHCQEIALNTPEFKPWRQAVCREILQQAKVPENIQNQLQGLDVPVIATLVAYDFIHHGIADNKDIRQDDYRWLINRLKRNLPEGIADEDFTLLLGLLPFGESVCQQLADPLQQALSALQDQGWVSYQPTANNRVWQLGHDLLSDIALTDYLLSKKTPWRYDAIQQLGERAKALGAESSFARALSRALDRIISSTFAPDIVDTLDACILPLSSANPHPERAQQVGDKTLFSISLALNEKIRTLRELSGLSHSQLTELIEIFNEEQEKFQELAEKHSNEVQDLVVRRSLGNETRMAGYAEIYQLEAPFDTSRLPPPEIRGAFIPEFYAALFEPSDSLSQMPTADEISALPLAARRWISENMFLVTTSIAEKYNDPSVYDALIARFANEDDTQIREQLAKAMFNKAIAIAERDNNPSAYDDIIESFAEDDHAPIRLRAAKAMFNKAIDIAERDNNPSAYDEIIDSFAKDDHAPIREIAAQAMFNKAKRIAERDNNPSAYDEIIDSFAKDDHSPIREQAAQAMFNKAYLIAERDNNPSAYDDIIETFLKDDHPPLRLRSAQAMLNKAIDIAKRDNNPSAYDQVIEFFGKDDHPPIREQAAHAMVNKANRIAERDNNPSAYDDIIDSFAKDDFPSIHELAAKAMFNKAYAIAERDNDPSAYDDIIDFFAKDEHPPLRELAVKAMLIKANSIAERDNNPSAYDETIATFLKDDHPPIRELAAYAMASKAIRIAKRDNNPAAYDEIIESLAKYDHPPIGELVIRAKAEKIGCLVVVNDVQTALVEGEAFLTETMPDLKRKAVVSFLIWLAEPNQARRARAEKFADALEGEKTDWTFDEFSEKIAGLSESEQAFAKSMMAKLEAVAAEN